MTIKPDPTKIHPTFFNFSLSTLFSETFYLKCGSLALLSQPSGASALEPQPMLYVHMF
ncbi:hypothetical protein Desac_1376 [Desulfobacca acetoxidans DSM 11109]|uniref:Uncharacterized protein n=1 Tax=Desulfobacca acetoxidans (strain ATCC 700848 / DSM 11109 / ASRB2) TaxID=880072 RepID=F2NHP5_DESAR|nr:hypothetical protein Desac_1376 [Desulfobacca acetoxidans DSM 11109]